MLQDCCCEQLGEADHCCHPQSHATQIPRELLIFEGEQWLLVGILGRLSGS